MLPDGSRADQNDPNYQERQKLQGSWKVVSCRVGGKAVEVESPSQFVFDESQVTVHVKTKSLKSRYALNARKAPKALTLSALTGQSKGPVNGIYSLRNNTLVLCLAIWNKAPAPTEMETVEGDGRLLITLHRLPGPDFDDNSGQTDRND